MTKFFDRYFIKHTISALEEKEQFLILLLREQMTVESMLRAIQKQLEIERNELNAK